MKSSAKAMRMALVLSLSSLSLGAQESGTPGDPQAQREAFLAMEEHMKLSALEKFPAAGVPGTPMCEGIRLGIAWLDETRPEFFLNPSWPMRIAQAVQRSLTAAERVPPAPPSSTTPRFPLRNDAKAKVAYRARKSDERQAEVIRQLALQLDDTNVVPPSSPTPRARLAVPTAIEIAAKQDDGRMRAQALRLFPSAGIPGTPLHEGIRRGIAWLAESRPDYFRQENWPELLANAVQNTLDPLDRITPTIPPDQKLAFPALEDAQAAATYLRYKHEREYADGLKRLSAEIDKQAATRKAGGPSPVAQ